MAQDLSRSNQNRPAAQSSTGATTRHSTGGAARTLGKILDRYRASKGWQPLPDADHMQMVAAMLEVLEIAGVPVGQYENCFRAARQAQLEKQAAGESVGPLGADEMAVEWIKIKKFNDEMEREGQKVRMLAKNSAAACQRCFGKEPHVRSCDHRPITDEERAEQARINAVEAKRIREGMRKVGAPKPPARAAQKVPPGLLFKCDSCRRTLNVLRELDGAECGALLNRYTSDEGKARAAYRARYGR